MSDLIARLWGRWRQARCKHLSVETVRKFTPGSFLAQNGYATEARVCLDCGWTHHLIVPALRARAPAPGERE